MGRLIDANTLMNKICKEFQIPKDWDGDIAEPLRTVIDMIDNEPTAYDTEKVVADIEDYYEEAERYGFASAISDIVEVVKMGGISCNNL